MMRLLDISFKRPSENLAFDEVLLDGAEGGQVGETLRFWESRTPFVVLGVSQVLRREVWEKNCVADRVPVFRRSSAGGCVLQGPGCLNFSLVLRRDGHPELKTIRGSYCYILGRISEAFRQQGAAVRHKGVSDLAMGGKKVSGNAQKRRRKYILHHGTLLYGFDAQHMERYLREPGDRPQYRGPRTHRGFLRALPIQPQQLKEVVCEAFDVGGEPEKPQAWELRAARALAREKHEALEWIRRR